MSLLKYLKPQSSDDFFSKTMKDHFHLIQDCREIIKTETAKKTSRQEIIDLLASRLFKTKFVITMGFLFIFTTIFLITPYFFNQEISTLIPAILMALATIYFFYKTKKQNRHLAIKIYDHHQTQANHL